MRFSYGGLCYNDIQNMNISEIFEYHNEIAKLVEKENRANQGK